MRRVEVRHDALLDFLPQELGVVQDELDVLLAESHNCQLLVELLCLLEALSDESLAVFPRQLAVLRLFDRQSRLQHKHGADGELQRQVGLRVGV